MSDETPDASVADDAPEAEAPAPEPVAEPNPVHVELLARLSADLGDALLEHGAAGPTLVVRVSNDGWHRAAEIAKGALACDFLSFVAGIDWSPAPKEGDDDSSDTSSPAQPTEMTFGVAGSAGRFQVFAQVQSTSRHWGITFKTDVDEATMSVPSWVDLYPGADWHERECWEMYGIAFAGHPALRHLYLPADFEGYPLRKDFPLLARVVKPWPGLVDVEPMPDEEPAAVAAGSDATGGADAEGAEA